MAKIYGLTPNQIIPQGDFSAARNENGGWTASQTFRVKKGGLDNVAINSKFKEGESLNNFDPNVDSLFAYLLLSQITGINTIAGGYTDVTCEFVGFAGSTSTNDPSIVPIPTFAKRGTLRSAPLSEHKKWKALTAAQKTTLGYLISGLYRWDIAAQQVQKQADDGTWEEDAALTAIVVGDAAEFADRIAQGDTTYEFGTYEYTHRWEDNEGISESKMNRLGKIVEVPTGDPPKPGNGRNWLLVGANEEQYGSGKYRFTNELQFLLSDEGGWDAFLYE